MNGTAKTGSKILIGDKIAEAAEETIQRETHLFVSLFQIDHLSVCYSEDAWT